MTGNQIAYWNLQEAKRANLINEGIKQGTLDETRRSNLIKEGIQRDDVDSQIARRKAQTTKDAFDTSVNIIKAGTSLAGLLS